jgi:multiple sugar transport system permease protein
MNARRPLGRSWLATLLPGLLLAVATLAFLGPLVFMLAASLRPNELALTPGWSALLPVGATLANYRAVFTQLDFLHFLRNSLFIVGTVVVAGLLVNSLAGYALARLRWPGRNAALAAVVVLLIIPYEAIAVPLFFEMTLAGWTESFRAQIVPFIANPFAIYLFYTFFKGRPRELEEAARMDGAGPWRTFFLVMAPLARPAYAAVAILTFLLQWSFFLWPLMVTSGPKYQPLAVALGYFSANKPVQWGEIMAFGTLMVLPVLVVFLAFQKWFVRGIAMSGIKG